MKSIPVLFASVDAVLESIFGSTIWSALSGCDFIWSNACRISTDQSRTCINSVKVYLAASRATVGAQSF